MIDLDQPLHIEGVSLYADHRDPRTFHVLPGAPSLAGAPALWLWRDPDGAPGGLFQMAVRLSVPDDALAAVRRVLGDDANLVPALLEEGTVRLLVPDGIAGASPSARRLGTAAPWTSIHAIALDGERATLFAQLVRDAGTLPIPVVAEVRFQGLARARQTRITVDAAACQEVLRQRLGVDTLWARLDVTRAVESLMESGGVTVEDLSTETIDPAARFAELRELVTELLSAEFWRPEPPVPHPATGGAAEVRFSLREAHAEEARTRTWDLTTTAPRTRTILPQGVVSLGGGVVRAVAMEASELVSPPRPVVVLVPAGADWTAVKRIQVDLRAGDTEASVLLDPTSERAELNLPASAVEARIQAFCDVEPDALGEGAPAAAGWAPLDGRTLAIDPAAIVRRRALRVELDEGGVGVDVAAEVTLTAGDRVRVCRLTAGAPTATIPTWGDAAVTLRAVVEAVPTGGARREILLERAVGPAERVVYLGLPPGTVQTTTFTMVDPLRRIASVHVDTEDPPRTFRLDAAAPRVRVARVGAEGVPMRFRERRVGTDGAMVEGAWREADGSVAIVGDAGVRLVDVTVILQGAGDHVGGVLTVRSEAPAGAALPDAEVMLDPGADRVRVRVAAPAGRTWRGTVWGTLFDAEGGVVELGPLVAEDEVVLLQPASLTSPPAPPPRPG
ncbi:MAG: hypothetical protein Q8P41_22580 [Pseudomonadota bacterium]|nr:hypothetical protein [Pseudomonadota bacterium]